MQSQLQIGSRAALPKGTVLDGTYRIQKQVGHGGYGIVYRARHEEIERLVAIKEYFPIELAVRESATVHPRDVGCQRHFDDGLNRFLDEAKQLVEFEDCPNIVSCSDFFRQNGTAYMVMDFEEGMSLAELLVVRESQGRPLDEAEMLSVVVPLLEGMKRMHEAGVLHRDIKPSNIIIRHTASHESQRPVLIDFGAAKQAMAEQSRSYAPYTDGYAAIEQVSDGQLGPWTDIYAVGALMWRIVAGGHPQIEGLNPEKVESRAGRIARGMPDPLSSIYQIGASRYSSEVLSAIERCLQLAETDRFQDCKELLDALQPADRAVANESASGHDQSCGASELDSGRDMRQENQTLVPNSIQRVPKCVWFELAAVATVATLFMMIAVQNYPGEEVIWYQRGAEQGYASAQVALGKKYRAGSGVERDLDEALKWVRRAAEQGDAEAQYELGSTYVTYSHHLHDEAIDAIKEANQALVKSIHIMRTNRTNHTEILRLQNHSELLHAEFDQKQAEQDRMGREAVRWYQRGAEQGHVGAQNELGWRYRIGIDVEQDLAEAARWYRRAAEQGDADAQVKLGEMHHNGQGVEQNFAEAVKWYRSAADNGDATAHNKLGLMYYNGWGVIQDSQEAYRWWREGARKGNSSAQANLGMMYEKNPQWDRSSLISAYVWYDLAASNDLQEARNSRERLSASMTKEELIRAQALAKSCRDSGYRRC